MLNRTITVRAALEFAAVFGLLGLLYWLGRDYLPSFYQRDTLTLMTLVLTNWFTVLMLVLLSEKDRGHA